jgi:hypothetical protein
MYLRIRKVEDRITVSGILVQNGYKVSQVKIEVPNQKAKALVLKVEEASHEA